MTEQYIITADKLGDPLERREKLIEEARSRAEQQHSLAAATLAILEKLPYPSPSQHAELTNELIFSTRTLEHSDTLCGWLVDIVLEQLPTGTYSRNDLDTLNDQLDSLPDVVADDLSNVLSAAVDAINAAHDQLDAELVRVTAPSTPTLHVVPTPLPTLQQSVAPGTSAYVTKKLQESYERSTDPIIPLPDDARERILAYMTQVPNKAFIKQITDAVFGTTMVHPKSYSVLRALLADMELVKLIEHQGSGIYNLAEVVPTAQSESPTETDLTKRIHAAGVATQPRQGKVMSINHRTARTGTRRRA